CHLPGGSVEIVARGPSAPARLPGRCLPAKSACESSYARSGGDVEGADGAFHAGANVAGHVFPPPDVVGGPVEPAKGPAGSYLAGNEGVWARGRAVRHRDGGWSGG